MTTLKKSLPVITIIVVLFVGSFLLFTKYDGISTSVLVKTSERKSREIAHTIYFVNGKAYWLSFTNKNYNIGDCFELSYSKKFPSLSKVESKKSNTFSRDKVIFWGKHYPDNLWIIVKQGNTTIKKEKTDGFFALELKLSGQYSISIVNSDGIIENSYLVDFSHAHESSFLSVELKYSKDKKHVEIGIRNGDLVKLN